nr:MAG TPA: hypothetical protein [Caudoviricetes sp.]
MPPLRRTLRLHLTVHTPSSFHSRPPRRNRQRRRFAWEPRTSTSQMQFKSREKTPQNTGTSPVHLAPLVIPAARDSQRIGRYPGVTPPPPPCESLRS